MRPHNHFGVFFLILALLALFANTKDWLLDIGFYALAYAAIWLACTKWKQDRTTLTLLILAPLPHLLGAFGLYNWSYGNLSYDIIVHIASSFITVLLLASIAQHHRLGLPRTLALIIGAIIIGAIIVEIVEWTMGETGEGEGMFKRGAGDYCAVPRCSQMTDTYKDMLSNALGTILGIIAIFARPIARRPAD